jgi:putative oxidoreductase
MIALGFLTRIAAFIASGEMAVGYFFVRAPGGFFPIQNHDEPVLFYRWFFFFVVFYGPGRWSLDAFLSSRDQL